MNNITTVFNAIFNDAYALLPNVTEPKDQVELRIKLLDILVKTCGVDNKHLLELENGAKEEPKKSKKARKSAAKEEAKAEDDMPVVDTSVASEQTVAEPTSEEETAPAQEPVVEEKAAVQQEPVAAQEETAVQQPTTEENIEPSPMEVEAPLENGWTEEDKQNEAQTLQHLAQYEAFFKQKNKMSFMDSVLALVTKNQYTKYTTPYDLSPKTAHLLAAAIHNLIEQQKNKVAAARQQATA